MRPHIKRALGQTIVSIETEAIAPYLEALREVNRVLEYLASRNVASRWDIPSRVDFVTRAEAAHQLVRPLAPSCAASTGATGIGRNHGRWVVVPAP